MIKSILSLNLTNLIFSFSDFPQPYGWIGSIDDNQFAPPGHEDFEAIKFPDTKLNHKARV